MSDTPNCGAPLRHPEHPYTDGHGARVQCNGAPTDPPLSLSHYDHRSQTVAQIRELADWIERNPDLPGVHDVVVHAHLDQTVASSRDRFTGLVRQYASDDQIGQGTLTRWCNLRDDDRRERGGIYARFVVYGPLESKED